MIYRSCSWYHTVWPVEAITRIYIQKKSNTASYGWKAPSNDDFVIKVAEIDSLEAGPTTVAGRGESIVILNADGNTVSVTEGRDHPTATTTRDKTE